MTFHLVASILDRLEWRLVNYTLQFRFGNCWGLSRFSLKYLADLSMKEETGRLKV